MEADPRALALAERLLEARADQRRAEHRLARLLAERADERLDRALGYASVAEYAAAVLDLNPRQTRDLVRLGRLLPGFPAIDAALGAGELDWTKAREILRVATAQTEAAWLDRARVATARVLEHEVANALVGEPPPSGEPTEPRAPMRRRVVLEMESVDAEALYQALAVARSQVGLSRDEVEDGALLAGIVRRFLHDAEPEHAATGEPYRVVVEHCPDCRKTAGTDAEVSETVVAEAACDAEILEMRPGPRRGHVSRTVPPATRRAVFQRDRSSCVVPHCRNRTWLHLHHTRGWVNGHLEKDLVAALRARPHVEDLAVAGGLGDDRVGHVHVRPRRLPAGRARPGGRHGTAPRSPRAPDRRPARNRRAIPARSAPSPTCSRESPACARATVSARWISITTGRRAGSRGYGGGSRSEPTQET